MVESSTHIFIVLEFCSGGDLQNKTFGGPRATNLVTDLMAGLTRIHALSIMHLDIKRDNLFLTSGRFKIGDFGCAQREDGQQRLAGDARFHPPEVCRPCRAADVWAAGLCFHSFLVGELPLHAAEIKSMGWPGIDIKAWTRVASPSFSPKVQELLGGLLQPKDFRWTAAMAFQQFDSCILVRDGDDVASGTCSLPDPRLAEEQIWQLAHQLPIVAQGASATGALHKKERPTLLPARPASSSTQVQTAAVAHRAFFQRVAQKNRWD